MTPPTILKAHRNSERLVYEAECYEREAAALLELHPTENTAQIRVALFMARELYTQAAFYEEQAMWAIEFPEQRPRTFGVLAVGAVSLYAKAGMRRCGTLAQIILEEPALIEVLRTSHILQLVELLDAHDIANQSREGRTGVQR